MKKQREPKKDKIKEFKIKVPVFATERIEGSFKYADFVSKITTLFNIYNTNGDGDKVSYTRSNKTQTKVIDNVECFNYNIGDKDNLVPVLLLQISTFTKNIIEGFIDGGDGVKVFDKKTKLGSKHNYILLYPNLVGYEPKQKANWIVLVYGDTNKNDTDIINTSKLVVEKILNLKQINIKPVDVINDISNLTIPQLQIRFVGIDNNEYGVGKEVHQYLTKFKLKKEKIETFESIPFNLAKDLMDEDFQQDEYQKKEARFTIGNKSYKLTKEYLEKIEDASIILEESAEQMFTDDFNMLETEIDMMYNHDFIVEKLSPIILNYIKSYGI